jgi:predicted nucleic acid-binding protein
MMNSLVLIDSSVWIEVGRKDGDGALKEEVAALLRASRTAMTWPVWVELHQGAKGRREEDNLQGWRELSRWLEFDDDCWSRAATTARICLRGGVNVPFGDILIHSCSERYAVRLLERDRHFAMIREAVGV